MSLFPRTLLVYALLWLGVSSQVLARDLIIERAFIDDPSGVWTVDDARAQQLKTFSGLLTQGYGTGAIWVRLRINPGPGDTPANEPLFLRIRPIFLDSIQLYDQAESFVPRVPVGDRHPLSARDEPGPFYVFELSRTVAQRDVWLRIETTSTRLAHFEVLEEPEMRSDNFKLQMFTSVYLALIGTFLMLGLIQSVIRRDTLNWSFTGYQFIAFAHGAIALGYARWWAESLLPPAVLDGLFSFFIVCLTFAALLFTAALLREISQSRWRNYLVYGIFAVLLGLLILQFTGFMSLSLLINSLAALILPTLFFIYAIFQPKKETVGSQVPGLPKAAVTTYFGLTLAVAYLGAMPVLGWFPAVELSLYWIQIYCVSSGLLMLGILQYRAHIIDRQRDTLIAETRSANERAALERAQRVERQQLLNMLGHELKTPMATIKMLLGDRNIPTDIAQRLAVPITEMKDVVERTVQSGQLEDGGIELQWQACDLPALIRDQLASLDEARIIFTIESATQESPIVQTDPHFLSVIIRNLLDNALKYSPDNSAIQLRLLFSSDENSWRLIVGNQVGRAGRPDPEKLFVKYWRSPSAAYRSGSGQGLYIVYRLAGLLGGRLSLEPHSELVLFRLEMPVTPGLAAEKQT